MLIFVNSFFYEQNQITSGNNSGFATGGTLTQTTINGLLYYIHTFTTTGATTFTVASQLAADILIVGGGGGGGGGYNTGGCGGGGGGGYEYFQNQQLSAGSYVVTVGAGGAGGVNANGTNGGNSSFQNLTSAYGGGGGCGLGNTVGSSGASGGGGGSTGGSNTCGTQGYSGGVNTAVSGSGVAGGGGGAGAVGSGNGNGGNGVQNNINGTSVYYAGGGGGGCFNISGTITVGTGGLGGGANGLCIGPGKAGQVNTGGGGGGTGANNGAVGSATVGGAGGSGIVIVRYQAIPTQVCVLDSMSSALSATGLYACKRLLSSYTGPIMQLTDPATVLLLHCENPSTNSTAVGGYIDASSYNNIMTSTTVGGAGVVYSTTQCKFGTSSMYFDGKSTLTASNTTYFQANNFTIEFWMYPTSLINYGN